MDHDKNDRVTGYARRGAAARLAELVAEIEFIHKRFPQLRRAMPLGAAGGGSTLPKYAAEPAAPRRPRRKPKWTAAMKKVAADRMKKYWAARRLAARKS